jgi:ABC-type polysaccharide/polyol phosphate export permease
MHVLYRDVAYVVDSILLVLFWLTPIVYPIERVPETIRRVLLLSPLTGILSCLRDVVIGGRLPTGSVFLAAVGTSFACFLAGVAVYRRHAPFLADYV